MNDLFLSYYTNDTRFRPQEELDLFFEYQGVIQEDLKRIYRLVERDYPSSEEKESLLFQLKCVIKDVVRNRFKEDPEMELNISVYDNYLVFSYYKFNDRGKTLLDTPSIVIITRDMKNLYFIDEDYSVFYDEEEEDDLNRGHDEIIYFKLCQDDIKEYRCTLEEYTADLFHNCFARTYQMIKRFEAKGEFVFARNACFDFYNQYKEMYYQVCELIHRDYESYYEKKYLDDGFLTGEEKALEDKHYDIVNILKKMIYMLWNCWEYTKDFPKEDFYMIINIVKFSKSEKIRYAKNIYLDEEYQNLCRKYTNS